ncbi:3-hydroxyacyl-CoA dehydrogenase NAD-binding domain-containing protein [Biformimicrobium ophioploci]|uniref:3-hydroxyacyl-CoA dehydrogenase NAD-binding domain-containing protein n=1 Tax=Biformimicrobium ophioploci TaxID=3036711 RepID=A0ABQ6M0F2_9GAMM|nr:3-hydroxyacyl-CoA dehydrogenase NAD-binding domain-containing protein [Microbulbifer sp. NKW57]GMG87821.1 3-hydroxyacyl-CoA dehydrogenase NAD-binding domain-containing protein [Microbulbifer sp. NKW57]
MKNAIQIEKDSDNIVHLILDNPNGSANVMDADFQASLAHTVQQLQEQDFAGIIVRSAKKTFFAGGDLNSLYRVGKAEAGALFEQCESLKANLRWLETRGKPVVACINGAALGGGWELALACHQRIVIDDRTIKLGLPEVTLGLLPGGGGCVRLPRLLGIQTSLPYLLEGKQFSPKKALDKGLVHQLAANEAEMLEAARTFILANPACQQPWDVKGYRMPGGTPASPKLAQVLMAAPAMLKQKTRGCLPAPEAILATVVEGAQVNFDTATRIESRYFVELATGQIAKNMIGTFWSGLNAIKAGASLPDAELAKGITEPVGKVAVLGAGMMGAGIAYACAMKGCEVVLKDVSLEAAEHGKAYTEKSLRKRVAKGRSTEEKAAQILQRIHPTEDVRDLAGCGLVIEAVFEKRELKAQVTRETEAQIGADTIFASNTSTLPITGLAQASARPPNFIGLHFFSPAEKMPLVEIICGEQTSDETLARAFNFVLQIGKTPIIVNDSRGFFTSRVFGTYTNEGIAMLGEGVSPAAIENGAALAGFPVGPLAVSDEVSLILMGKIRSQTIADLQVNGETLSAHPADAIIDRMLEEGRAGKLAGGGFYDYPEDGPKHLWPGLGARFGNASTQPSLEDIKDRLLFIMAIESVRCLQENILRSVRDANIGSIFGIGYPPWTGGVLQFINQYGVRAFCQRAEALAEQYGERFTPPAMLVEYAEADRRFSD